jgi:hypothetical protein
MPNFQSADPETVQSYDGVDDGAVIPDDDILNMQANTAFMLETIMKFKTVDSTTVRQLIVKQEDGIGRWELQLNGGLPSEKNGKVKFSMRSGPTLNERINCDNLAEINKWYHFVGTRDASGNCKIYENGVQQTETVVFNYDLTNDADVGIAHKPYGSVHEWADVYIEETRITKDSVRSPDYIKMVDEEFRDPETFYGGGIQNNLRGNLKTNLLGGFL